jgi:protease II
LRPGFGQVAEPEILLDQNLLLADPDCAGGYVELGVREVSPDGQLLAYSVDFDGDEVYQLRIRDLIRGSDLADRIGRTYYGLAWSADSRTLFYVVTDEVYRPHEVWRHRVGTDPRDDILVYQEDDERYELTVRATRSGEWILIESECRDTTETLVINEWDEWGDPRDPQARAYLASYSPYDNVPVGRRPDLLVTGSLHDPRVLIHEPAKWVARLRATDSAGSRLLFRPELGAGAHVGPAGRYDKLGYEAEVLAFVVDAASRG